MISLRKMCQLILTISYPAEDYPEYAWEDWNLISVSRKTHNKLHDRNTDKLTAEGAKLLERTVPKERRRT